MKPLAKLALFAVAALPLAACSSTPTATSPAPATSSAAAPSTTAPSSSAPSTSTSAAAKSYTLAEVAKHNTQADCWAAVDGSVYDLTQWIGKHPGGADKIIPLCGTDATDAFRGQHNTQAEPNQMLASFKIGTLSD